MTNSAIPKVIDADRGAALLRAIRPFAAMYSGSAAIALVLVLALPVVYLLNTGAPLGAAIQLFIQVVWPFLLMLATLWIPKRMIGLICIVLGGFFTIRCFVAFVVALTVVIGTFLPEPLITRLDFRFPAMSGALFAAGTGIGFVLGIALVLMGVRLTFASTGTLKLAFLPMPPIYRPDRLLLYLLGVDPRQYLGRGLPRSYAAAMIGLRIFSGIGIALLIEPFLRYNDTIGDSESINCAATGKLGDPRSVYCYVQDAFPALGIADSIVASYTAMIGGGLVLAILASALSIFADRLSVMDVAKRRAKDQRESVLFLRSFSDDRVRLKRAKFWQMFSFRRRSADLDEMFESVFGGYAPVVALGRGQKTFGASRLQVGDTAWQSVVLEEIERAKLIVLVLAETPGVRWEIDAVHSRGAVEKTAFIVPPDMSIVALTALLKDHPRTHDLMLFEKAGKRAACLFFVEGEPVVFVSATRNADVYDGLSNYLAKFALKPRWLTD